MKKILSILLVVLLSLTLFTGCNWDKEQSNNVPSENTSGIQDNQTNENSSENELVFTTLSEDSISAENAMQIIEELTSQKYTGRLTGTAGNELAIDYIANYFNEIGLEKPENLDGYLQRFTMRVRKIKTTPTLELISKDGNIIAEYKFLEDFKTLTKLRTCKFQGEAEGEIYEVQEKSDISDDNKELEGKILLVDKSFVDNYRGDFYYDISKLGMDIRGVIINEGINANAYANKYAFRASAVSHFQGGSSSNDSIIINGCSIEAYNEILKNAKDGVVVRMRADFYLEAVKPANVIGVIPGTDEALKDEYIIISAHMDHVGDNKNGTYNAGALDNASGTATVMEIARALAESKIKPKKTIIFIAFNGEEEGLKGSVYYIDNPIYPLKSTTVINLDMVGSKTIVPLTIGDTHYKDLELNSVLNEYAKTLGIESESKSFGSSDHVPFNSKGVEAVILIHEDYNSIHTPGDTIENVDKDRLKEVMKLILFYLDKNAY